MWPFNRKQKDKSPDPMRDCIRVTPCGELKWKVQYWQEEQSWCHRGWKDLYNFGFKSEQVATYVAYKFMRDRAAQRCHMSEPSRVLKPWDYHSMRWDDSLVEKCEKAFEEARAEYQAWLENQGDGYI